MPPKSTKGGKHSGGITKRTKSASTQKAVPSAAAEVQPRATQELATRPVYFWRENQEGVGYLSQWYPSPFTDPEGNVYPTAEHYMMHQKALLFGDTAIASAVLAPGTTPRQVKDLGRRVAGFSEEVWCANRERIVLEGTLFKFTRPSADSDIGLRELLLGTGDRELVEASPYDRVWGVGFREKDAGEKRAQWGLNLLGKALMDIRELIRKENEGERREGGVDGDGRRDS